MQWHFISSNQLMGQYDDVGCTLATCILFDAANHGRDYHNAVNRIEIRLKTLHHAIPASRFVSEHNIKHAPVFDVASKVAEVMVTEMSVQAAASVHRTVRAETRSLANDPIF